MQVNGIKCSVCSTVIYSRARHDFNRCRCKEGGCAIDGGRDYFKASYNPSSLITMVIIELPKDVTNQILYNDWNKYYDKFGTITNWNEQILEDDTILVTPN